jgi:hypothetical protein
MSRVMEVKKRLLTCVSGVSQKVASEAIEDPDAPLPTQTP